MKVGDTVVFIASKMDNSKYSLVKTYSKHLIDGQIYTISNNSYVNGYIRLKEDNSAYDHPTDIFDKYEDNIIKEDYSYLITFLHKLDIK